uniref:Autophagy protein 5 n=1 Tax=Globisporangium ultimum (strain ATCC 200006 / CBS 805.95 / DAOM BR144) TaxID=431595 RepID=K3WW13_GLOUD
MAAAVRSEAATDAHGPRANGGTVAAIEQKLWSGCIPVVFSLHASEVTTLHAPRPFYAMIPRMSYLVAQTREVVEYFRDAAPPFGGLQGAQIWFEAPGGTPLKWHLPFGVLWDTLGGANEASVLPWPITVHFQSFPSEELLPCENEKSIEIHFMHSLKQATFLRSGSTKVIMGMPEAQQSQIWTSVIKNDYQSYREATKELQLEVNDRASSSNPLRMLPIRVHVDKEPAIQMPIAPFSNGDEGQEKTLHDVLGYLLPDLFPSQIECKVVVHGIPVPPEVSVLSLYRNFAYPDGFLYVSVVPRHQPNNV